MKINLRGDSVFWSNLVLNEVFKVRDRLSPMSGGDLADLEFALVAYFPYTRANEEYPRKEIFHKRFVTPGAEMDAAYQMLLNKVREWNSGEGDFDVETFINSLRPQNYFENEDGTWYSEVDPVWKLSPDDEYRKAGDAEGVTVRVELRARYDVPV